MHTHDGGTNMKGPPLHYGAIKSGAMKEDELADRMEDAPPPDLNANPIF